MNRIKWAEKQALILLEDQAVLDHLPIPIEQIAKKLGITVVSEPFDGDADMEGMIYKDSQHIIIGINAKRPVTYQRYAIAHLIGVLKMHIQDKLYIARDFKISFRDLQQTTKWQIEANAFASALLLPESLVRREFARLGSYEPDGDEIRVLASKFRVSPALLLVRAGRLELLI